jgi:hypothetical protein
MPEISLPLGGRLTPEAVEGLGALAGASKQAIEAAISAAPFSFRVQLFAQIPPLIATEPSEADALAARATRVDLTDAGQAAILECAAWIDVHGLEALHQYAYC